MKRLLCMFLALILLVSLCACGSDDSENATSSTPSEESAPDGNEGGSQPTQGDEGEKEPATLKAIGDVSFTIDGKKFQLGIKLSEFIDSGVGADISFSDETLEAVETGAAYVTLLDGGKGKVSLRVWNLSRQSIDIEDATIVGLWYYGENLNEAEKAMIGEVSFAGVQLNDTIEKTIGVFGKPNVHEKTWENEENRSAGWRGFDINDEFRLYITAKQATGQTIDEFSLEFKPFTDSIQ